MEFIWWEEELFRCFILHELFLSTYIKTVASQNLMRSQLAEN